MPSQNDVEVITEAAQAPLDAIPDDQRINIAELREKLTELEQKIHDAFLLPIGPVGISHCHLEHDNAPLSSESNPPA